MNKFTEFVLTIPGMNLLEFIISLIVITSILWFSSYILSFKKQDFKTAFLVSLITSGVIFLISIISAIPSLLNKMGSINWVARIIGFVLLIILIQKFYHPKWWKIFIITIISFVIKMVIFGVLFMIIIILSNPYLQESAIQEYENYEKLSLEQAQQKVDFEILVPEYIPSNSELDFVKLPRDLDSIYKEIPGISGWLNGVKLSYLKPSTGRRNLFHITQKPIKLDISDFYSLNVTKLNINGYESIYTNSSGGSFYLAWYSEKLKLSILISSPPQEIVDKEEAIKIAESLE